MEVLHPEEGETAAESPKSYAEFPQVSSKRRETDWQRPKHQIVVPPYRRQQARAITARIFRACLQRARSHKNITHKSHTKMQATIY